MTAHGPHAAAWQHAHLEDLVFFQRGFDISKRRVIRGFRQHETSYPLEIASFEAIDDSDLNWDKKENRMSEITIYISDNEEL
jgi:hypothetical protein